MTIAAPVSQTLSENGKTCYRFRHRQHRTRRTRGEDEKREAEEEAHDEARRSENSTNGEYRP
jgi:hypothetical protein